MDAGIFYFAAFLRRLAFRTRANRFFRSLKTEILENSFQGFFFFLACPSCLMSSFPLTFVYAIYISQRTAEKWQTEPK